MGWNVSSRKHTPGFWQFPTDDVFIARTTFSELTTAAARVDISIGVWHFSRHFSAFA
jgi:hypothetical protein